MPMLIEVVNEIEKIEKVLPKIKEIVDDNGLVTIQSRYVVDSFNLWVTDNGFSAL